MTSGIQGDPGLACGVTRKPHLGFADPTSSRKDEEEGQLSLPLCAGWPTCSLGPLCGPHSVTARSPRSSVLSAGDPETQMAKMPWVSWGMGQPL